MIVKPEMIFLPQRFLRATIISLLLSLTAIAFSTAAPVPVPAAPELAARSYVLMDFSSGKILAENNAYEKIEPASLTKLMTAYIVFKELQRGTIHLDDEVLISKKAWRMGGSRMFIEVNKHVSIDKLLKGMIVQSGNDATVALAEHVAGSEDAFVTLMNEYVTTLGMTGTHFVDSSGLPDPQHYTTAYDLALLTRLLIAEFPEYYKLYSIREFTYNNITQYNRNKLLWRDENVDGVKTGHTESAGYCLVASAHHDNMRLISVVIGTDSDDARAQLSEKILNYGFRFFETHRMFEANKELASAHVWKGVTDKLPLGLQEDLFITVPRGQYDDLTSTMNIDTTITAPASKDHSYGTVEVSLDGEKIAQRPLIALQDVGEGSFFQRIVDEIRLFFQ
jgi:serine-type D-Ala-D-Ala carboxypeptidase (penicillin-binding protein 5/6)